MTDRCCKRLAAKYRTLSGQNRAGTVPYLSFSQGSAAVRTLISRANFVQQVDTAGLMSAPRMTTQLRPVTAH